jgi:hypothetical protein
MKTRQLLFMLLIAVLGLFAASGVLAKKKELPEVTVDGLHLVPDSNLAVVYAEPGADLAPYNKVKLLDAYVAFKKNWERDQRSTSTRGIRVSSKDMDKIKSSLAEEFQTVFQEALQQAGYEVTEETGDDVMIVRPAIINLDVNAPDTNQPGRSNVYTSSAGEMTLYIGLYDSVTGDMIAKAIDRQFDRNNPGFYTWTSSVTNRAAALRILKGWADILVNALNEAKTYGSGNESGS